MLNITNITVALVNKTTLRNKWHFQLLEQLNTLSLRIYTFHETKLKNRSSIRHIAFASRLSLASFS